MIKQDCIRIDHSGFASESLFSIESKHLCLKNVTINLAKLYCTCTCDLRMMTICRKCHLAGIDDKLKIDTLRFIDLISVNTSLNNMFQKEQLIESLDFHNTVKNMTLNINFGDFKRNSKDLNNCPHWEKNILNVLLKKNYFHLSNVNILLEYSYSYTLRKGVNNTFGWFFDILKKNQIVLKHQFKQLNIGLRHVYKKLSRDMKIIDECKLCYILKWHPQIDNKFLDQFKTKFNKSWQSSLECQANALKYQRLKNQWL